MTQKLEQKTEYEEMLKKVFTPGNFLKPADKYNFKCNSCGKCCYNQDIIVSTYDLLKLRRELGFTTMAILENYCTVHQGPNSKIPVCVLKFTEVPIHTGKISVCSFLKPTFHNEIKDIMGICTDPNEAKEKIKNLVNKNITAGNTDEVCTIHENSPDICKLYPLGRGWKMDIKHNTTEINYFPLERKNLPCDDDCFKCNRTLNDHLKDNNLIDIERAVMQEEYNKFIGDMSMLAIKHKEKFTDYQTLFFYLVNFDILFIFLKFDELADDAKTRISDKLDIAGTRHKNEMEKIITELKKYKPIDFELLGKSMDKDTTDQDLNNFFRHLLDIYKDIATKLTAKYAKRT